MSFHRVMALGIAAFAMSACTASLGNVRNVPDEEVRIVDRRPEVEKAGSRAHVLSPVEALGDDVFKPTSAIAYLKDAIARAKPEGVGAVELELTRFRVIDFFPHRLAVATSAGLAGSLGSLGYGAGSTSLPTDSDAVLCVLEGSLNGKAVQAQSATRYSMPLGPVRSSPGFIKATRASIDACAAGLFAPKALDARARFARDSRHLVG